MNIICANHYKKYLTLILAGNESLFQSNYETKHQGFEYDRLTQEIIIRK